MNTGCNACDEAGQWEWCTTHQTRMGTLREVWDNGSGDLFERVYDLSDGYGEPGYIPVQGYDWSGIRDSSPAAIDAMYEFVVVYRQGQVPADNRRA